MDLQHAADELKNIHYSAVLVIQAWRDGDKDALTDALTELESELVRVEEI